MYLYENPERSVYAWNAVDVEIDGQLQHGYVVGLKEEDSTPPRLIVDFGCPQQQAVLVPYGKIFDCSNDRYCHAGKGTAVEVLLHDGPQRPWRWFPGTMLVPDFQHLYQVVLVEVALAGQSRRELVPRQQIRDAPGEAAQRTPLTADQFVIRTCRVPSGYWIMDRSRAAWLLRHLEKTLKLRLVTILSQKMHSVRRRPDPSLWRGHEFDEHPADVFESDWSKEALDSKFHKVTEDPDASPKRKRPLTFGERKLAVPLELLKEVFHSLDTVDRLRCRRTCQLWEAILTSAELCQVLLVSRQQFFPSLKVGGNGNYVMYSCIFKQITPATRTICIRETVAFHLSRWNMQKETAEALALIKTTLDDADIRIVRLILYRRSIRLNESTFDRWAWTSPLGLLSSETAALQSHLGARCERLVLKDYLLTVASKKSVVLMESRIPLAVFVQGQAGAAHIVDLWEQNLHCQGRPLNLQHITDGLANLITSREKAKKVMKILRDYQANDPRPSAQYRGRRWCVYNVATVDVAKLNRFCL
ncbi:uncharacterized protein LOC129587047 [Paramacrobiotus metropolitanus]|uniref:uncharacterized protein LOC129587047 n=1 Tax=Paramacrobiotus metropolitanus TaxID=2943436 RepID=UPI002445F981|nr:uncharacterized protein LOC129587047 [Paramacrobiotus metropolitanus]